MPNKNLRLKWRDVDFEQLIIRVWSAKKNIKMPYRDVPLQKSLFRAMVSWFEEDSKEGIEYLIAHKGKPVSSVATAWRKLKTRAGITRRLRLYDTRHEFATNALIGGADIKAVADMMGHADSTMILKIYQHTTEASRRKAIDALPDFSFAGNTPHVTIICDKDKLATTTKPQPLIL